MISLPKTETESYPLVNVTKQPASTIASDPDRWAPVSGLRCRSCGKSARRADPDELWLIQHSAAFCPACTKDAYEHKERA